MTSQVPTEMNQPAGQSLPQPDPQAQAGSGRLVALMAEEAVASGGVIPFDRYMELALYAPGSGYYTGGGRKFGAEGDFITAPEISPLFGRCLAQQVGGLLAALDGGDLLEFGAGSGRLAADLLQQLWRLDRLPRRYLILELSAELQQRQRQLLQQRVPELLERVEWLQSLPQPGFQGVVLANELLDAMPVHRFRVDQGELFEQFVRVDAERLETVWGTPVTPGLEPAVAGLLEGRVRGYQDYESEINLRAAPWIMALGERFDRGALLLIDYGYPAAEFYHPQRNRGTLMCHYRHRVHEDPCWYPGLQDITAHVDFSALAEAALAAGFQVYGYSSQANFLLGNGLDRLLAESDPADTEAHLALVQQVKRLTLPTDMGERFKVLGLGYNLDWRPEDFTLRDMRERL